MSSNGKKEDELGTGEPRSVFHHPVLCETENRKGKFGPFKNFKFTRPYLDPETGKSKPSNWHSLNQETLAQLSRHLDELQEVLDEDNAKKRVEAKTNGASRRRVSKKRKAANGASSLPSGIVMSKKRKPSKNADTH